MTPRFDGAIKQRDGSGPITTSGPTWGSALKSAMILKATAGILRPGPTENGGINAAAESCASSRPGTYQTLPFWFRFSLSVSRKAVAEDSWVVSKFLVFGVIGAALLVQGCVAANVVGGTVGAGVFVGKTAIKGAVGTGKVVYKGGKATVSHISTRDAAPTRYCDNTYGTYSTSSQGQSYCP